LAENVSREGCEWIKTYEFLGFLLYIIENLIIFKQSLIEVYETECVYIAINAILNIEFPLMIPDRFLFIHGSKLTFAYFLSIL
jgi:hypothetical protein